MIDGVPVKMGGTEYIIPPLNFRQLKALQPIIKKISETPQAQMSLDVMSEMSSIVLQAMRRNYPDMTQDDVDDLLDMSNMLPVYMAVMTGSGLTKEGEEKPGKKK